MPTRPFFSVLMPSYNHGVYIGPAIRSVLAQSFSDFELIVFDDGSSDDTLDVVRAVVGCDRRVSVYTHPGRRNRGRQLTLREAAERSKGSHLAFIGSDDRWTPSKLALQARLLHRGHQFVYALARRVDQSGNEITPPTVGAALPRRLQLRRLLLHNPVPACTVAVARTLYERAGGFDDSEEYEDLALWLRCLSLDRSRFINARLADYRVLDSGVDATMHNTGHDLWAYRSAVEALATWPNLPITSRRLARSWARCWKALTVLLTPAYADAFVELRRRDAKRFATLLDDRRARLEAVVGAELPARVDMATRQAAMRGRIPATDDRK